jgi:hypothetical protein
VNQQRKRATPRSIRTEGDGIGVAKPACDRESADPHSAGPPSIVTIAEAARREKVSEQSIGRRKADFLEAGNTALAAGRSAPSAREQQLEAEVADLT